MNKACTECNKEMNPNHFRDVEILKRPASPDFSIWDCSKGTTDINVPIHYLLAYLEDIDKTSEHDDMFITGMKLNLSSLESVV